MGKLFSLGLLLILGYGLYSAYLLTVGDIQIDSKEPVTAFDVGSKIFNKTGQLYQKISAKKIEHFGKKNINLLDKPIIDTNMSDNHWHISANKGTSYNNNNKIKLYDQVKIVQSNKNEVQFLDTSLLWYYPKAHTAETSKKIYYKKNQIVLSATGMHADLNSKHIELLHDIKAKYAQKNSKSKDEYSKG